MSANQQSVMTSNLESKVDVEMSLDDHSGKNEVSYQKADQKAESKVESFGLDDDDSGNEVVTLYLIDRKGVPVFYVNKKGDNVKAEFKLTRKELGISGMFFDVEGKPVAQLDSSEAIPIPMSWATGSNPNQPNPYTTDDAAYSLAKCVEWMKHFNGFKIGILGQILGTNFKVSLRCSAFWGDGELNYIPSPELSENMKMFEKACRQLDSRTRDKLAENVRRKLVREKLLVRIRELKGMPPGTQLDVKTENKLIYEMRDKIEQESPHIKWVEAMLEETKEEEDKYFKENPPWFLTWIKEICDNGTFRQLCGVMSCASYLDIKPLVSLAGGMIATILKHKTKPKIREEIEIREARVGARA